MTEANVVMDNFMKRLAEDGFKKENQPNDGPQINDEFVDAQVLAFSNLLKSGIIDAALNE